MLLAETIIKEIQKLMFFLMNKCIKMNTKAINKTIPYVS